MTDKISWEKEIELVGDIEKKFLVFLEPYKETYTKEKFNFNISKGLTPIEISFKYEEETQESETEIIRGIMLEVHIYSESKQIHISNISIPHFMTGEGIGRKIISIIFNLSEKYDYKLFMVDMEPDFYKSLIKRNASPCNEPEDSLCITKDTNLDK